MKPLQPTILEGIGIGVLACGSIASTFLDNPMVASISFLISGIFFGIVLERTSALQRKDD